MLPWPSAISRPNRFAPAQNASGASLPITSADAVALGAVDGLHHHRDDVGIDRVHLGVELEAEDAVAEVEDRRAAVALHLAAGGADRVERQRARVGRDRREAAALAELRRLARRCRWPVEAHAFALGGDLLPHPAGHGVAGGLHLLGRRLDAQRVPGLERPALPAEPPAQRAVDVDDARRRSRPGGWPSRSAFRRAPCAPARRRDRCRRPCGAASRRRRRRRGSRRWSRSAASSAARTPAS